MPPRTCTPSSRLARVVTASARITAATVATGTSGISADLDGTTEPWPLRRPAPGHRAASAYDARWVMPLNGGIRRVRKQT
jgi:hypothetical protein